MKDMLQGTQLLQILKSPQRPDKLRHKFNPSLNRNWV